MRESFTSWSELATYLELSEGQRAALLSSPSFPLLLPRRLAEKIEKGTLEDPILRQFVALREELEPSEGFGCDPVGEKALYQGRLLQKYQGRALLLVSGSCAMHCRYCFRKETATPRGERGYGQELADIRNNSSLREIILSGGDPLSLSNEVLSDLFDALDAIPHLERLRIHTRFPIGIPERIEEELLSILKGRRLTMWWVIHTNHAREFDDDVVVALGKLQRLGIPLLNQSALLRGINDSLASLEAHCTKLINHGIMPYYLNQLDPVAGAAHFQVPKEEGVTLIAALRERLSGFGVPLFVQEVAGSPSKTPLN